jgi:hypothetical protein
MFSCSALLRQERLHAIFACSSLRDLLQHGSVCLHLCRQLASVIDTAPPAFMQLSAAEAAAAHAHHCAEDSAADAHRMRAALSAQVSPAVTVP